MLSRFTRTIIRRRKWKPRELHSTVNGIACREILYRIVFYLSLFLSLSPPWKVDSRTIANWNGNTHSCRQCLWFIGVPGTSPLATTRDGPLGIEYNANPLRFPIAGKRDDSRFPHVCPLLTMQIRIDYNRYRWYAGKQIYPIPRMRARDARLYICIRESIVDVNFQSIEYYIPSEYSVWERGSG